MKGSVLTITAMFLRSRVTFHFLLLRMETFLVNTRWLVPCLSSPDPPPPPPEQAIGLFGSLSSAGHVSEGKGSLGQDPYQDLARQTRTCGHSPKPIPAAPPPPPLLSPVGSAAKTDTATMWWSWDANPGFLCSLLLATLAESLF